MKIKHGETPVSTVADFGIYLGDDLYDFYMDWLISQPWYLGQDIDDKLNNNGRVDSLKTGVMYYFEYNDDCSDYELHQLNYDDVDKAIGKVLTELQENGGIPSLDSKYLEWK